MTLSAMLWALRKAPVESAQEQVILIAMADFARDDGSSVFLSQSKIAATANCSVRTVRRHLQALEARGVIYRGDQQIVAHYRIDHRPIVWNLNVDLEREDNLSPRSSVVERQDKPGTNGRTPVSDKPRTKPTTEPRGSREVDTSLASVDGSVDKESSQFQGVDPDEIRQAGLDRLYDRMGWTRPSAQGSSRLSPPGGSTGPVSENPTHPH
jgi:biotin operon repressor